MKTTQFFNEIKNITDNCELTSTFSYVINPDKRFFEILLHNEPTEELRSLCEKKGFIIKKNILHVNTNGEMVAHDVWEIRQQGEQEYTED